MLGKLGLVVLATALSCASSAYAQGNAAAGKTVFANQCASCHSVEPGRQGSVRRWPTSSAASGTLPGYSYTPAMANSHLTWDKRTLDEFITASTQKVPGTSMPVDRRPGRAPT